MSIHQVARTTLATLILLLGSCSRSGGLHSRFARPTPVIQLPDGVIELSSELALPPGAANITIRGGKGSVLKLSDKFGGRAAIVAGDATNLRLENFEIDGNRAALAKPAEMLPDENAYRLHYRHNGLLFDQVRGLRISSVRFREIASFAILVSRSTGVAIDQVAVTDSGGKDARGRNNTTGGVLIEEGTTDFTVTNSRFERILGNALWTHSLFTSPRLEDGVFSKNRFDTVGRDAIQIGHATRIQVDHNSGVRIGYPAEIVDMEHDGTPVAVDTAGNVDRSVYAENRFEEINGKCFDLDGFHDGQITGNICVNRRPAAEYPHGHFALVMNNNNPDMESENIRIVGNLFDGAKFGGIYVIGHGHEIAGNILRNLNIARCTEQAARFGCLYGDDPALLRSGIYLGKGVKRLQETRDNVIRDNRISGWKMKSRCIAFAPGVARKANQVTANRCEDQ
ncbi:MAG: right-handed parallel beta-helix repeat-containing protein [Bryobacteraceae bacterium]|nr:right-handed parallel beta-helix repeat-containing protein [Bryobacteraceae bacterium]